MSDRQWLQAFRFLKIHVRDAVICLAESNVSWLRINTYWDIWSCKKSRMVEGDHNGCNRLREVIMMKHSHMEWKLRLIIARNSCWCNNVTNLLIKCFTTLNISHQPSNGDHVYRTKFDNREFQIFFTQPVQTNQ